MRACIRSALVVLLALGVLAGGCQQRNKPIVAGGAVQKVALPDLELELWLPRTQLRTAQEFTATVVVRNTTFRAVRVLASTGAPVCIRLYRRQEFGCHEFAQYPPMVAQVLTPWTLRPGQQRVFEIPMTVGPDWPTGQPLRLATELNGRGDAVVYQTVTVSPAPPPKSP